MNTYFYINGGYPRYDKIPELLMVMENAIKDFNDQDVFLLQNDLHETSIASCLKKHIENQIKGDDRFQDIYVDIEYNRGAGGDVSAIKKMAIDDDEKKEIRIDIAITSREYDDNYGFHNLISVEIKKEWNKPWDDDLKRLQKLTAVLDVEPSEMFGYLLGVFIVCNKNKMWIERAYDLAGEIPKDQNTGEIKTGMNRYDDYVWWIDHN